MAYSPQKRKEFYERNKEKILLKNKEYRNTHKEKIRTLAKLYHINFPEETVKRKRKRRARQMKVQEFYTVQDEQYTMHLFSHKCFNCGKIEDLCIDHVYPLSKGFALTRTNACILCNFCNCSKGSKMPYEFYSIEKLIELFLLVKIITPSPINLSRLPFSRLRVLRLACSPFIETCNSLKNQVGLSSGIFHATHSHQIP